VTTPTQPGEETVPLTGETTWTQNADELIRVVVQVNATTPSSSACEGGAVFGSGLVRIREDGVEVASVFVPASPGKEETVTRTSEQPSFQFEPGKGTLHTLTAKASDSCEKGGGHFTINSVAIDVIGVR